MNKIYLLDTNVVSEFSKERPNEQVISLYQKRKDMCAISSITWQELTRGIRRMPEGRRKNYLQQCLDKYETSLEILPYDKFASQICGELQADAELSGSPLPSYDSQIAATAISNAMVLVTRNTKDFEPIKQKAFLRIENWFSA